VISRAEEDGRLKSKDNVVEYKGGSTGASLALVCAARGYRLRIVSSDAFSQEKLDQMAALGAQLTLVRSEAGLTTRKLILDMIETARELSAEPHPSGPTSSTTWTRSPATSCWRRRSGGRRTAGSTPSFTPSARRLPCAGSPPC
jgi:cysteine synthase